MHIFGPPWLSGRYHPRFYKVAKQMRPELHVLMTDGCCWSAGQRDKAAVHLALDVKVIQTPLSIFHQ